MEAIRGLIFIYRYLSQNVKQRFKILVFAAFFTSLLEASTIFTAAPVLGFLVDSVNYEIPTYIQPILLKFGLTSRSEQMLFLVGTFVSVAVASGVLRIFLIKISAELSALASADLVDDIFAKVVSQRYSFHKRYNTSDVISLLSDKVSMVTGLLMSICSLFNSTVMLVFILVSLIFQSPLLTLTGILGSVCAYYACLRITRVKIDQNSKLVAILSPKYLRAIQEALKSIREMILSNSQLFFSHAVSKISREMRMVHANNIVMSQAPRYVVEMLLFAAIGSFAAVIIYTGGDLVDIAALGVLAIGAQRMLPLVQMAYSAYVNIRISKISLVEVQQYLDLKPELGVKFEKDIADCQFNLLTIENVYFRHEGASSDSLCAVNLKVKRGQSYLITGESGAGKSTLVDVISGLLAPSAGQLCIDGKSFSRDIVSSWQSGIAYVPQTIFLVDKTIAENVAFGIKPSDIDFNLLSAACEAAGLKKFLNNNDGGLNAMVGEAGEKISGGQRQRIGIARALYRQPKLLILDESTSALDEYTTNMVLTGIDQFLPLLTLLHISHNSKHRASYDNVIEVQEGGRVESRINL
jgi:ATP-binding cassette, subfamily B, bacterial PglK